MADLTSEQIAELQELLTQWPQFKAELAEIRKLAASGASKADITAAINELHAKMPEPKKEVPHVSDQSEPKLPDVTSTRSEEYALWAGDFLND